MQISEAIVRNILIQNSMEERVGKNITDAEKLIQSNTAIEINSHE